MKPIKNKGRNLTEGRIACFWILGISVLVLLYAYSCGINGNDFWWHVKVGQWIAEHGQIPKIAIFSWYGEQHQIPWTAHEWLSEVIFYGVYACMGEVGIFVLSLLLALAMLLLIWNRTKAYVEKNPLLGGLFVTLLAITMNVFFYGRPHLFSFFLVFWELQILYDFSRDTSKKSIWLIPVIACIWSNIHGGSSNLSYMLCIAFWVAGVLNLRIGCIEPCLMDRKSLLKLSFATVGAVAAIGINPAGLHMLIYPYQNMGDTIMLSVISEWGAPDAKSIGQLLMYYLPIVLMLIGFFAEDKKIRLIDLALMGVFMLLFLRSVRFIMLWYIAAAFCAMPYVPECKVKPIGQKGRRLLLYSGIVIGVVLLVCIGDNAYKTIQKDALVSKVLSEEVVEVVREDGPQRLYNDYNLGEALIYNEIPVFYDARADIYAYENILADGVGLGNLKQLNPEAKGELFDPEEIIEKYDFDAFLVLKQRPIYAYLVSHELKYVCLYQDDTAAYFRVVEE